MFDISLSVFWGILVEKVYIEVNQACLENPIKFMSSAYSAVLRVFQ